MIWLLPRWGVVLLRFNPGRCPGLMGKVLSGQFLSSLSFSVLETPKTLNLLGMMNKTPIRIIPSSLLIVSCQDTPKGLNLSAQGNALGGLAVVLRLKEAKAK